MHVVLRNDIADSWSLQQLYLQFYPSGCSHCSYYSNRGKNKKFCPPGQLGKFWWNISGLEWSLLVYLLLRYADEKKISKIRWPRGQTLFEFDLNLSTIKFAWSGPAGECLFQPLSIARWYIFKDMIFICQKISKPTTFSVWLYVFAVVVLSFVFKI